MNIRQNLSSILLSVSFIFACLIVITSGFPYFGLGLSFIILATLLYRSRERHSFFTRILFAEIIIVSIFVFIRANQFLTF